MSSLSLFRTGDAASRGADFTNVAANHGADVVHAALSEEGSPHAQGPLTLVAVPRDWWPPPTQVSELPEWRTDHGEATRAAVRLLASSGYDRVQLALGESPVDSFSVLDH